MIDFVRRKIAGFHENLVKDVARILKEENHALQERLESIEEQLRLVQRQERRRQILLDSLSESSSSVRATLDRMEMESPRLESLLAFAESFLLAYLASPESSDKHILGNKFFGLLEKYDLTPIAEVRVPFDPELHEACGATRIPELPDGVIAQIVRPGFLREGKLLRAAVVMVNRNDVLPEESKEEGFACLNLQ